MVEVVCGVIGNGMGAYLACQRPEGKHLGGLWEFPGGKVDPGETPQAALVRELMEELGVLVEVGEALEPVIWAYERTTIRLSPFRCKITSGELRNIEHQKLHWCSPSEFASFQWAEADLPILAQL
jgi:8-oxo-dGTP diphosphatase